MNINNKRPNYAERYIEHADTPETRARGRRWKAFLAESGLKENLQDDPPKHRALIEAVGRGLLAHTTNLELGNMAVLMTEHYHAKLEDFDHEKFAVIEVPTNIAPYCGSWDPAPGGKPGTKTFLITSILKKRQLEAVLRRLEKAAASMPLWNYAGEDEE
jgi:hypothetical protein